MEEWVVRLASLTLNNIKNVKNGTIYMPQIKKKQSDWRGSEILGIYGQNGSGKTAVVDTLYFLQHIMIGEELDQDILDYIDIDSARAEVNAEFRLYDNDVLYEVGYHIVLAKRDSEIYIEREYLNCAFNEDGKRKNKNIFMDYQRLENEAIFKPQKRFNELVGKDRETWMDLLVARKMAEKSNCSYIFGENSREIFFEKSAVEFERYAFVIKALYRFALKDLFVIKNSHSGVVSANLILPMAFRVERERIGVKGDFAIPLTEPVVLDAERKELLEEIVKQINTVLYTIIPEMQIDIRDNGKQAMDSGEEGWKVELMSVRGENKPIPIRMESDGIIKIVSILNALIQAFGNPSVCLVVDELDAGIFEYMLGEILSVFDKSAKGQLIFTSHNLRALEMLDKDSIMFSTVNPNNRYIYMRNVKESNNLRSMYIRSITLGGQEETIYEETDSLRIARAFRKGGRSLQNGREKSDSSDCRGAKR